MEKSYRYWGVLLATIFLLCGALTAQAGDTYYKGGDGTWVEAHRCGTHTPTPAETAQNAKAVAKWLAEGGRYDTKASVVIPIAVHIVAEDGGYGDITDAAVYDQLDVLNAAYNGTSYSFTIASIDRTYNTKWSTARYGSRQATQMKQALAIDPATTYNLYFCNIGGGLLGYATFPDMYPEDSYMHGVVALFASVPGGAAAPYNEGDTVTHETGHYLGLYHTFQDGCTEPNDYCDDTPQESSPAYGCPIGRDTCPTAGDDPIKNFMDYSDDYCMDHFTNDQSTRMDQQMAMYRPTMWGGTTPTGPTAGFTGTPTSGDFDLVVQFTDTSTGDPTSWSWNFGDGGSSTAQNPSHTYTAAGTYTVSLLVANGDGSDTMTRNGYITVTDPGTGGDSMHVDDIVVTRVLSGRKYYGRAVVTIVDNNGGAVSGATVTGIFTGDTTETRSGVTGADGTVSLQTARKATGANDFCFEVTGVAGTLSYDSGANVVTKSCEDGDVFRDGMLAARGFNLYNTPNPFNPMTEVMFNLEREMDVSVKIFDARGHLVATLQDGPMNAGLKSLTWDARLHPSGIYFCQLRVGNEIETNKMMLLK